MAVAYHNTKFRAISVSRPYHAMTCHAMPCNEINLFHTETDCHVNIAGLLMLLLLLLPMLMHTSCFDVPSSEWQFKVQPCFWALFSSSLARRNNC